MSFESQYRIIAVAAESVPTMFPQLLATFGSDLLDGNNIIRTIGGHWDDTARTRKRAASFPTTITGQILTDSRMAFRALWETRLSAAYANGDLPGVEELTEEQFQNLLPEPDPEP